MGQNKRRSSATGSETDGRGAVDPVEVEDRVPGLEEFLFGGKNMCETEIKFAQI